MQHTIIEEKEFSAARVEQNGSRLLIANGYMGYRGTLEEFGKEQLVALNMAGLFDKNGDAWRESVNLPNPFYTAVAVNGETLSPLSAAVTAHRQWIDIYEGVHRRETAFAAGVTVTAERFVSMAEETLAALSYTVRAEKDITLSLKTGVDADVWSINGQHFTVDSHENGLLCAHTGELGTRIEIYEHIVGAESENTLTLRAGESFSFYKLVGVYWGEGCRNARERFAALAAQDYAAHRAAHTAVWADMWQAADVEIEGDEDACLALRYSLYHLLSIAPRNSTKCGIPARGLSGQVYKGASFWDTEMFMLPFFSFVDPLLARNLVRFRIATLDGARKKARELGYEGAFYPWECQETGEDACTLFNVTDIFTGRPLRTYFKDRQIHVSADMVYGLFEYCTVSGDYSLLFEGGLEMMYECLYFYYSYAAYKPLRGRFELPQTVGPDEYHERVDNNAFTNRMVAYSLDAFERALAYAQKSDPAAYTAFTAAHDLSWVGEFKEKLYVPAPNADGVIEQFDGYFGLEDIDLPTLKSRIIEPNEYLGGHGLASTTRILKQADVLMMLNVFRAQYSEEIKRANWEFYEPYTEHGSSLSACAYAIVAAEIGMADWAYKYFMKTATVDLTGDTKQYLGTLYIGGTHPAANGGSWSTAVFGFGGVSYTADGGIDISPRLPAHWTGLSFKLLFRGARLSVRVREGGVAVTAEGDTAGLHLTVYGKERAI